MANIMNLAQCPGACFGQNMPPSQLGVIEHKLAVCNKNILHTIDLMKKVQAIYDSPVLDNFST